MNGNTLFALAHPLVVMLIGIAVLALWRGNAQRLPYLLYFGLSYLAYSIGVSAQILLIPTNHAFNVVFSGMMYLFATMFFARGLISLSGACYAYAAPVAIIILSLVCRAYFVQVEDNGIMRASLLHGSIFLIFLHAAYVARGLRHGLLSEKITFYAFILFTLTTPLKLLFASARPAGSYGFDFSSYWAVTTLSIYAFALIFGLALITTIIQRNQQAKQHIDENLSLISHDLRAPLATIVGNLRLLQESATPEQRAHMQAIERSTQYQNSLINDIIAGRQATLPLQVHPEPMDLGPFLAELSLHGRTWSRQHYNTFSLDVATTLPGRIRTDGRRLKQALLNLLSNAALATHEGGVGLRVKSVNDGPGLARVSFEVHDTGHGVELEHQSLLFNAYQRFDQERTGTGLGLYIARRIADNLAGTLNVKSEPGKGSCFSLTLTVPTLEADPLPLGWQPAALDDDAAEPQDNQNTNTRPQPATPQPAMPQLHRPAEELCQQLAAYASQGRYSDIQDWIALPALQNPKYQGFRSAIQAALDDMDFDRLQTLAQNAGCEFPVLAS